MARTIQQQVTKGKEEQEEEQEAGSQRPQTQRGVTNTKELMTATVRIRGERPLLMSSPKEVFESSSNKGKTRKASEGYDDEEEAEKRAYRDEDGDLCVPARCLTANLIKAAKLYKTKNKGISFADMIKGSLFIEPENPKLLGPNGKPLRDYKISKELVVVQRARIVRARPLINAWELEFQVKWNPKLYGLQADQIHQALNDGGYIGICDWRPRYGIFSVVDFKVQKGTGK